jgi:hypothetical protein
VAVDHVCGTIATAEAGLSLRPNPLPDDVPASLEHQRHSNNGG